MSDYLDFGSMSSSPLKSFSDYELEDSMSETDNSFGSGRDTITTIIQTIESPLLIAANYLLFGTFMSFCHSVQLNERHLKLSSVKPNILGIAFTFDINIGFSDITRLMCCSELFNPLVFIELNPMANQLVQRAMNLGDKSPNGLRFDVNSNDIVDRYIVIDVCDEQLFAFFSRLLIRAVRVVNNKAVIKRMLPENARRYLGQNHRKCVASYRSYRKEVQTQTID